jgi:mycothiol synthase
MSTVVSRPDLIRIPEAPPLAGLRFRHYGGTADHPAMARINTAARRANGGLETVTAAQLDADYAHLPNCDLDRDFVAVELDGALVGYGRVYWIDRNDGTRAFESICMIDPAARGKGIGSAILAWQRRRSAELRSTLPDDRPAVETAYAYGRDLGARALLEGAGHVAVRRFCELTRADFDGIPDLPLPDGFEARPIDRSDMAMIRRVWDAGTEAFAEHWGESAADASEEQLAAFMEGPSFQPELWQVAFHDDEVAGHILNYLDEPDSGGSVTGWTESIAVRKPYRRRGLARALLARSLRTVRDAGATRAALGVDTENVNHALELYESLGFVVFSEQVCYQRPIDASSTAGQETDR